MLRNSRRFEHHHPPCVHRREGRLHPLEHGKIPVSFREMASVSTLEVESGSLSHTHSTPPTVKGMALAAVVEPEQFDIASRASKAASISSSDLEVARAERKEKKARAKAQTAKAKAAIAKLRRKAAMETIEGEIEDIELQQVVLEAEEEAEEASLENLEARSAAGSRCGRSQRSRSSRRVGSPAPTIPYEDELDEQFESLMAEFDEGIAAVHPSTGVDGQQATPEPGANPRVV